MTSRGPRAGLALAAPARMDSLGSFRSVDVGRDGRDFRLSRGLGWLSLGLGLTELAAPRQVADLIGVGPVRRAPATIRALGVREILTGLGLIARPRTRAPLWLRLVGDALDVGLLAWAGSSTRSQRQRNAAALAGLVGASAIDLYANRRLRARDRMARPVLASITIQRPVAEVYAFFRRLENLPLFMDSLESVEELDERRSRWVARLPLGRTISWDAELIDDRPGEVIAWRTVDRLLAHQGRVTFATAPSEPYVTEVRVEMELGVPGLAHGATLARVLGATQIEGDLRRLKQVMETGEVLFSDASAVPGKHPARPSPEGVQRARARAVESRAAARAGGR